jgi:hypothetical protein
LVTFLLQSDLNAKALFELHLATPEKALLSSLGLVVNLMI